MPYLSIMETVIPDEWLVAGIREDWRDFTFLPRKGRVIWIGSQEFKDRVEKWKWKTKEIKELHDFAPQVRQNIQVWKDTAKALASATTD